MTKISNNFTKATVDLDSDERFTGGALIGEPKNIMVFSTEGSSAGVLKNVPGNLKVTDYNFQGAKTIGKGKDESGEKLYNFIKSDNYDYLIEFDITNKTSTIVLQSTTGGVLNFIEGERILNFDIFVDAETGNSIAFWSGDSNPLRCVNIETAKTWGVDGFTDDDISVMKPSPIFAPTISLTTSIDGVQNNFINKKFLTFSYRYKYEDGYYSAPSSWTRVAFEPSQFSLDYQTYENNGMINLSNAVNVFFNVGPRGVIGVDLLFRESDKTTIYVVQQFVKSDEGWENKTIQMFQISKAKVFTVLPESQYYRNFDNVPLSAKAQTIIASRIAYANYKEGYNLDVIPDFDVDFVSTPTILDDIDGDLLDFVDVTDYSNAIDYSVGTTDGGPDIDQMNYVDNTIEMDLSAESGSYYATFEIKITPKAGYSGTEYTITVKEGATVLQQWTSLTGTQTKQYSSPDGVDKDVTVYVTADEGMLLESELTYVMRNYFNAPLFRYIYDCYIQLVLPKSTGYGSTLVGDTIIDRIAEFDLTDFEFKSGKQIRINFELQSTLNEDVIPSVTFFFNLTTDYTDITDFLTNSSFIEQLETIFSVSFKNDYTSGTIVTYEGFKVSNTGNLLEITTPKTIYDVTEPDGNVNKNEFFILTEANLITPTSNAFTSMHSNRDNEVVLIYMDEKGRKTTAIPSNNNTVYIPAEFSDRINKLKVTINSNPPSFAKYYKFAIKQPKKEYDTIYGNVVYKEGIYRYIQLLGGNKDKVNEGDILVLKSDYSGPLESLQEVKVLEVKEQSENFLSTDSETQKELPGLYMKIKQGNFNINVDQNSFTTYKGYGKRRYATRSFVSTEPIFGDIESGVFVPDVVNPGTQIRFYIEIKAFGKIAFNHVLDIRVTASEEYSSIQAWWTAEIEPLQEWVDFEAQSLRDWQFGADGRDFQIKPYRDGTASRDIITTVQFDVNFSGGTLIFETSPIENLETPFFETPETFTIVDGQHEFTEHILEEAFNCFCFGNGAESFKIQDNLTGSSFSIDSNPTAINKEGYRQLNRFKDITYSEVYNSNTNSNGLNEFNLSLANYKEDIEGIYGPIYKIKGKDTNIEVYQEDKVSLVYYGKDLLYNADGTTNLAGIPEVLGQQKTYPSENGISQHPDSYDEYATNDYITDVKRGVVLKKNESNGLFEISSQGMNSYFKNLFRNNKINHINCKYDQHYNVAIFNIQYNDTEYVTWLYSDKNDGWLTTENFNPEDMIRVNGNFFSFKNGEVYIHNQEFDELGNPNYNKFYGESFESEASFNFSQDHNTRKTYRNIELDGTIPADITVETNYDKGLVSSSDFEKKEGVFYGYIRYDNGVVDTSLLSYQGVGNATISGLTLEFGFELDSIISVGDLILNTDLQIVGTILSKTDNSLTLDTINNINSGEFVMASKPKSAQQQGLLGYYAKVTMKFDSNEKQEFFSVNSEVSKSFE